MGGLDSKDSPFGSYLVTILHLLITFKHLFSIVSRTSDKGILQGIVKLRESLLTALLVASSNTAGLVPGEGEH